MFAFKTLGTAVILAIATACQTTGSTSPGGGLNWAAHEEINRTYHTLCTVHEHESGAVLDREDTSRTYDACCPMIADGPALRPVGDDTSRTYHMACREIADTEGARHVNQTAPVSKATCEWAGRSEVCVNCDPR